MAVMPKYYKIHTDGHTFELEPIYTEPVPAVRGNPQTNADRIRAMSDEELAKAMRSHAFALAACSERAWLEWLKQPAE